MISSKSFCVIKMYMKVHKLHDKAMTACDLSSQDAKNLRGAAAYNYIMKQVGTGVLILEAAVNELIQFSPFNEMNGATQVETKYVDTVDIHRETIAVFTFHKNTA